jgi:hypothetical protein
MADDKFKLIFESTSFLTSKKCSWTYLNLYKQFIISPAFIFIFSYLLKIYPILRDFVLRNVGNIPIKFQICNSGQ